MRNRVLAVAILAVIFLGSIFTIRWYQGKDQAQTAAPVLPLVSTATVQAEQKAAKLTLSGTIEAYLETVVGSKVAGRVQEILVEDGRYVEAGQVLVSLESREAENSVRMSAAAVKQSEASLRDAQADYRRYQTLFEKGAVSEQQLSSAETKLLVNEAQHQAQLSALANAREQLGHASVTAPVAGYVANKAVVLGTVVNPGAALMQVHHIANVYLTVSVPQKDIAYLAAGQKVIVSTDAYAGRQFSGSVDIINPAAGLNSRVFKVKIKIDNADLALKPGMFAKGDIMLGEPRNVMTVAQTAIITKDGASYVYVVEGTTVRQVPVKVGELYEASVEVTGVSVGDIVVNNGVHSIKDGDMVRLAN